MNCPSGYDRCGKAYVEREGTGIHITGYNRGCTNAKECNPVTNTVCYTDDGSTKVTKCDIYSAMAPCAMEPNCQWSAPYCFWHAFFAVFFFLVDYKMRLTNRWFTVAIRYI